MKKLTILLLFLVAMSFVNFHSLGRFFIDEPLERGKYNSAWVTVKNPGDKEIEDVNVKFYIYDLGLMFTSVPTDIQDKDSEVHRLDMYVPKNVPPGLYITKISVGNYQFKDTQYIYMRII
jgi:hypothetical protein